MPRLNLFYVLNILIFFLLGACNFDSNEAGKTPIDRQANSDKQAQINDFKTSNATLKDNCLSIRRPLNPGLNPQPSETDLDRYFRLAYNAETKGNFDESIKYYQKAAELATCKCDRIHAKLGEQAATEANKLMRTEGISSKPTQFFWGRLQELTKSISCVTIR